MAWRTSIIASELLSLLSVLIWPKSIGPERVCPFEWPFELRAFGANKGTFIQGVPALGYLASLAYNGPDGPRPLPSGDITFFGGKGGVEGRVGFGQREPPSTKDSCSSPLGEEVRSCGLLSGKARAKSSFGHTGLNAKQFGPRMRLGRPR